MKIGYARISTADQKADLQQDALKAAGCEKIFTDIMSGAKATRPQLERLKEQLRAGDTVVVWRLDRLGRSLGDLISIVSFFKDKNVQLCSLQENIDTSSAGGVLIFQVFGAIAEFERNLIRERTNAGLSAARARGKVGGRPAKLTESKKDIARKLYAEKVPIAEICETLNIGKSTLYRYLDSHPPK